MYYALLMRGIQCSRHLTHDFPHAIQRHRSFALNDVFQTAPVQIFHYQKHNAVFRFAKIGDTHCMRM